MYLICILWRNFKWPFIVSVKQDFLLLKLLTFRQAIAKWCLATSPLMESYLQVLAMIRRQGYFTKLELIKVILISDILKYLSFCIFPQMSMNYRISWCLKTLIEFLFVQAVLWNMDTLKLKSTLEEHNLLITDVRFSSISTRLATSSFDKSVRVWEADSVSTWP